MTLRKCSVIGCTGVKRNPKISFFTLPKMNSLAWQSIIDQVNCRRTVIRYVCADHFLPEDIITKYSVPPDISCDIGNRLRCSLKKGVVPSIFLNTVKDNALSNNTSNNSVNQSFEENITDADSINSINEPELNLEPELQVKTKFKLNSELKLQQKLKIESELMLECDFLPSELYELDEKISNKPIKTYQAKRKIKFEPGLNLEPKLKINSELTHEYDLKPKKKIKFEPPKLNLDYDLSPSNLDEKLSNKPIKTYQPKPKIKIEPGLNLEPNLKIEPELTLNNCLKPKSKIKVEPEWNLEPKLKIEPELMPEYDFLPIELNEKILNKPIKTYQFKSKLKLEPLWNSTELKIEPDLLPSELDEKSSIKAI